MKLKILVAVGLLAAFTATTVQAITITDCCDRATPAWSYTSYGHHVERLPNGGR
jgi:hypothetical protein